MSSAERKTDLRSISSLLDERDRAIFHALVEHKVLTTQQLHVLFFRSIRRCQHRLRELKDLDLLSSFRPAQDFGSGRSPEHHYLSALGVSVLAHRDGVPGGQLPWVPDESYRDNRNLRHRMGVNAFFCALVEASLRRDDHGLHRWRPERKVRTRAAEIQPDGFGRYLHTGGACEFYLEYDRATEGRTALREKLRSYRRFAAGWGEGAAFPNLLVVVPDEERESDVLRAADLAGRNKRKANPMSIFVANEDLFAKRGMLGPTWLGTGSEGERLRLTELPASDASPYDLGTCLGRYWTDGQRWSHISPLSSRPRFTTGRPGER
jgi:hypothetical protein